MVYYQEFAPVAQWIRALVFGTRCRRFESYRVYHFYCMKSLSPLGKTLQAQLELALYERQQRLRERETAEKTHIVGAGGALTAAYEQLRNAAENAEEHVLLQRAVQRFFRRLFLTRDQKLIARSGEELAVELTHAGYLANDSITEQDVETINQVAVRYYDEYRRLEKARSPHAETWTLDVLAAEVESLLQPDEMLRVFIQFSYDHFLAELKNGRIFDDQLPPESETALYVAIHKALVKSDPALIRLGLLMRFGQKPGDVHFAVVNEQIDKLFASDTTERLYRYVDRHGAALRVLRRMLEDRDDVGKLLASEDSFLSAYEAQAIEEYQTVAKRIDRGIVRSVIFLIITKILIGVAIEVPYDYVVEGHILWTPLLINLLLPPVYMVLLRATMTLPSRANTTRLASDMQRMLYEQPQSKKLLHRRATTQFGAAYDVAYGLAFLLVFGGVAFLLWRFFQFSWLHLGIFFVFLSAASFLGFRLSRQIRELEAIDGNRNGVTALRDFIYMPFVITGRWISDKYSRVNLIAMTLDMLIELPLKTILRLVRQWGAFISSKQDRL